MDLSNLSVEEINGLIAQLPKEIERRKKENRSAALQAVKEAAASYGFTLNDLFGDAPVVAVKERKQSTVAIKYRNPENESETWTGRGIKPKWLQNKLAQGASIESFLV